MLLVLLARLVRCLLAAAVDFPKYHNVPPVSFSFDIWEEKTNKLVQFGACEITEKG
jgi:hypothetical protein